MLDVNKLSITINKNGRKLIDDLSFSLNAGDKIAVIGEEGNGKSTLIKAIVDTNLVKYATIEGKINKHGHTIGYLSQFIPEGWDSATVASYFLKDDPNDEEDYERYNDFDRLYKLASLLNFDTNALENEMKIGNLSGGEKIKIQLLKILMNNPDILILDEPTNDLDIRSLQWLENFISKSTKPILYISHDEMLLENTANAILHIEQLKKKRVPQATFKRLGYKEYVQDRNATLQKDEQIALKERAEDRERMEKWRQVYNRVDYELNTISRQDPAGARLLKKKMKAVKSQEKRFEKQREGFRDIPDPEEAINIKLGEDVNASSRKIFDVDIKSLEVGGKKLSQNLHLSMVGSRKYVIIGDNGVGKTTFLKRLYTELDNQHNINVAYMPQNYDDYLNRFESVLSFVSSFCHTKEDITKARTYLGSMKFTTDETEGKISELSGGQKAKLYLLKLILSDANLLLLDEPTRNLSPLSNPVIRNVFKNYKGAIVAISHDRKFILEVADEIFQLTPEGFKAVDKELINQEAAVHEI